MNKSEIRKMYNGNFIRGKNREIEHNGIIPLIYKRIICTLWKGHNYIPVSPEDLSGKRLLNASTAKNSTCGKSYYIRGLRYDIRYDTRR